MLHAHSNAARFERARHAADHMEDEAGWTFLGQGRHRATYALDRHWVIKIPHDRLGEKANVSEMEQVWGVRKKTAPHLAWCYVDQWEGVTVCLMERVRITNADQLPYPLPPKFLWVPHVDCWQVGYTRTRKLVAYDYSHN